MVYADEVVEAPDVPRATPSAQELKMAGMLVDQMVGRFEAKKFHDDHRERVLELVKQKAKGKTIEVPTEKAPAAVTDLAEALRRSLEQHKKHPGKRRKAA
jgi:DNA end-binding protein Ku